MNAPGVYVSLDDLAALRHQAHGFSFLPGQPVGSLLAGRFASRLRGRGLNFEEIRRYLPGDDIRHIDWKVTARTRKPHTRVFTEERERPLLLVVDQRQGMFFGSRLKMKSVAAAEAAALGAWRTLAVKDRVGAVVFNDTDVEVIRPHRSRQTVQRILGVLVEMNNALRADDATPPAPGLLDEALRRAGRLSTHDFLVGILTDAAGAGPATTEILTTIARHNDVLLGFVYDPLETELPDAGPLVVSDGRRQLEVDTHDAALRQHYATTFAERLANAQRFLLQRAVPLLPLSAAEDVADQLRRDLGGRRAVRRPS